MKKMDDLFPDRKKSFWYWWYSFWAWIKTRFTEEISGEYGTSKALEIFVGLAYSPADDAIDSEVPTYNKKDAIDCALSLVKQEMEKEIPGGSLVTVMFGVK